MLSEEKITGHVSTIMKISPPEYVFELLRRLERCVAWPKTLHIDGCYCENADTIKFNDPSVKITSQ